MLRLWGLRIWQLLYGDLYVYECEGENMGHKEVLR